jgi:ribosomal protein S18 acetylase RimI-like enzyme
VTVDASNEGAQRFYTRHGFVHHHDFTLYGRRMSQYRLVTISSA